MPCRQGDAGRPGDLPGPDQPLGVPFVEARRRVGIVFGQAPPPVLERWTGVYASADGHSLVETPLPGVRLVVVTGGTGASTAPGAAERRRGPITLMPVSLGCGAQRAAGARRGRHGAPAPDQRAPSGAAASSAGARRSEIELMQ